MANEYPANTEPVQPNTAPAHTNVSADQFNDLTAKVDKLTGYLQGLTQGNQGQAQKQPEPPAQPQQQQPKTPPTVAGMTEEQVKALVEQNNQFKQQARTATLNSLAAEKGVKLDDNLTKLILANSQSDDDLKATIDSLAKVETVQKPNPTTGGFKPDGSGEADSFQNILNQHFGKQNK